MGRKNRRADQASPLRPLGSVQIPESHPDGEWHIRTIPGPKASRTYRCPGCQQEIAAGVAHLVAWRADRHDGADFRRHWHRPCWQARARRGPG